MEALVDCYTKVLLKEHIYNHPTEVLDVLTCPVLLLLCIQPQLMDGAQEQLVTWAKKS